ncbi:MAG TPA: universal stress protein [Thermoleophilaceae bacterium]|nr:universal stress protein [Thermoleophilaceae bacterium]
MSVRPSHVIVLYRPSAEASAALTAASALARDAGARLTVLTVALVESVDRPCCDIRSSYWNQVVQERAADELRTAADVLGREPGVEFAVVRGSSIPDVLTREAAERGGDLIVVPRGSFPRFQLRTRRLRRKVQRLGSCRVLELPAARAA